MKNIIITILYVVLMGVSIACKNENSRSNDKQMFSNLIGSEISLPIYSSDMKCVYGDTLAIYNQYKYILYYDSLTCSECSIKNISFWREDIAEFRKAGIEFVLMLFPPKHEQGNIISYIEKHTLNCAVYLLNKNLLMETNLQIPDNKTYQSFLLDKNNQVVMIGNPFENGNVYNILKQKLLTLQLKK